MVRAQPLALGKPASASRRFAAARRARAARAGLALACRAVHRHDAGELGAAAVEQHVDQPARVDSARARGAASCCARAAGPIMLRPRTSVEAQHRIEVELRREGVAQARRAVGAAHDHAREVGAVRSAASRARPSRSAAPRLRFPRSAASDPVNERQLAPAAAAAPSRRRRPRRRKDSSVISPDGRTSARRPSAPRPLSTKGRVVADRLTSNRSPWWLTAAGATIAVRADCEVIQEERVLARQADRQRVATGLLSGRPLDLGVVRPPPAFCVSARKSSRPTTAPSSANHSCG